MIQLIRGFRDILPGDVEIWMQIEKQAISLFEDFGFKQIRIPIMEKTDLFSRSIGEDTDIVEKEMYTFPDRKGELITLRPEATASIVRSYIQHKMYAKDPVQKFYMIGPMFRRERPQKGRYRQFYQIDAEIFGVHSPLADAQLILMLTLLCDRLSVTDVAAHINSLGCPACRPAYRRKLKVFLSDHTEKLCADCIRRYERNPLRVLDCKVPSCREAMTEAPSMLEDLCDDCKRDFETLTDALERQQIAYVIDKGLVRGLDYYTRATFEIQTGALGAQSAVAGGGRYDSLIQTLGGPDLPATGFAVGLDRLAEIVGLAAADYMKKPDIFIAALGEKSRITAFDWNCALNTAGIQSEMVLADRSLKSQMKYADRLGAAHVLIVGETELEQGMAVLRNMTTKEQEDIPLQNAVERIQKKLTL